MVDWMAEVLHTFKASTQTFFLAVDIMDRYFKNTKKRLDSAELHLTGIVCMFIASKYEDVIPLLMKTVLNKIGHSKFSLQQVQNKELEILGALGFRIGAPTLLEHLERLLVEIKDEFNGGKDFADLCTYIAKLSCHNYTLS